jgi:anaerobic magnesium-protoporphyrin IX monomethyl ester cyclase
VTRVLLGQSYYLRFDPKLETAMQPYPPLGTLYAASWLRERGYDVSLFDAMLEPDEAGWARALAGPDGPPEFAILFEDNFNYLSKMCLLRMRDAAFTMLAAARAAGATTIVCGSDATDNAGRYLERGADWVIVGEGEVTLADLLDRLGGRAPGDPRELAGLAYTGPDGAAQSTGRRDNLKDLDALPFPAWDLVDVDRYRNAWARHGRFSMNVATTRGCPFHCNWCAKPIWGQRYAMRSPADVAAELATVKATIGPDHIWFADDIFGLRPGWLTAFAREVEARDARIPFTIQSRCDLMTLEAVEALAAAGCHQVWLGAESGSQRVLDAMDKGITVAQVRTARARLGDAGVRAAYFVQLGYPGERWADIRATIELVRDTLPDDIGVSVSYPLPGTRFHAMVADQLGAKANWESSGDLDMMFRGTYQTPFYRQLHLALHDDLDLHRRKAGLPAVPHPALGPVSLDEQEDRVARAWAEVEALEVSCRNRRPTLLVRAEPSPPAPDLSRPFN